MTETVLVTGAAGFIGSHTCRALLEQGHRVLGVDNFDPFYDRSLKEQAIGVLRAFENFRFAELDIRDRAILDPAVRTASVVIHLAARAGVRPSIAEPGMYVSLNVDGTTAVLEACRAAGVRRVVFASSSSVYGDTTPVPFREDAPAVSPVSPYAATKRAGELLCVVYAHLFGLRIAALRFFTVYGDRQRPDLAIHRFTRLLSEGRPLPRYGDGSAERDYTYVDDTVQGVLGAVRWTEDGPGACEIFNLGESKTVTLERLITLIAAELGVEPRIEALPEQPGDVRRTCADISKARRLLGYDPQTAIEDGIPRFVSWYEATYGRQSRSTG